LWCVSVIDIWWCSFVVTILLSLVLFGEGQMSFVPAGFLFPGRSLERDLQLFDEFALIAIDKWYQLLANTNTSVRRIQRVYRQLLRVSGVWLHYEWTWKIARDLCSNLRRVTMIRARVQFIRLPNGEKDFRLPP
jgi:hypothetical protein